MKISFIFNCIKGLLQNINSKVSQLVQQTKRTTSQNKQQQADLNQELDHLQVSQIHLPSTREVQV